MKTYICKAEISVKVEAENESDAILKVSDKRDLPDFYWEVEEDKLTEPTEEQVVKALAKLPFAVYSGKDRDGVIEITIPVKQFA